MLQNLMVIRFANTLFEPLWNGRFIEEVQISINETVGVEGRGGYYDGSGALRDMVQNHMLQLLTLTAMEPPVDLDADSIRDEKVKVLRSLRPITPANLEASVVRGQYGPGTLDGKPAAGYRQEERVDPGSNTETYVALKLHIDNFRWSGVPFYLRTGKRLPVRSAEIVVRFRERESCISAGHRRSWGLTCWSESAGRRSLPAVQRQAARQPRDYSAGENGLLPKLRYRAQLSGSL